MEIIKENFATLIIAAYFIMINIIGFIMAYSDKKKAEKGKRRISETSLFFISFIGGSIGMYCSMKLFRHKTKQKRFMIGIPLLIAFQLAIAAIICGYYLFAG